MRETIERRTIIRETAPKSGGGGAAFGVGALIVLLLVAVGAFLWWNSRHNGTGFGANPASTTGSTTTSPFGASGSSGSITDNPMADGTGPFGVAVGNYADEQGAVNERQRLNTLTDEPVTMSQTSENGNTVYRVVIGSFATRAQADSAGRALASTASLPDWKVVPIQQ